MNTAASKQMEKRVLIDLDRCIECRSCAAACCYSHSNMPGVRFARSGWALLPLICRQCKAASCVETCPADAMVRDEAGVVRRRALRCIGCGSCARACPFGVIADQLGGTPAPIRSEEKTSGHQVAKCDLCTDRTTSDPRAIPRCVAACPSGALMFADEHRADDLKKDLIGGRTAAGNLYKRR